MLTGKGDELCHNSCEALTEQKRWSDMNTSLRHLKFSPVSILSLDEFQMNQMKDFLVLSCNDSRNLRKVIEVLIKDSNRRQILHQGLLKDNSQLREELKLKSEVVKEKELQIMELEKELSEASPHSNQEVEANSEDYSRECEKCVSLEEEVIRLSREIRSYKAEMERQRLKSAKVFEELTKTSAKEKIDQNGEKRLKELLIGKVDHDMSVPSSSFKLLIKFYESKLDEYKKRIMPVQVRSNGSSKSDEQIRSSRISARPKSNFFPDSEYNTPRSDETSTIRNNSTKLVDLKQQPSSFCHKYIEIVCKELSICDLEDIQPTLRRFSLACQESLKHEKFFKEVAQLTATANIPRKPCSHQNEDSLCTSKDCIISTLEYWIFQMKHLKNLQESVRNLSEQLFPWKPTKLINRVCSSLELVKFIDGLIEVGCCGRNCRKEDLKTTSREQLACIVTHFQELFDVPKLEGVYTKMSQLYRKLGENHNFINNIKDILGLEKSSRSNVVIERITKLQNTSPVILPHKEIESLLEKIEMQDAFCSTFQETMQELMCLLGVNSIGQIPHAVKRLVNKQHLDSDTSTFY